MGKHLITATFLLTLVNVSLQSYGSAPRAAPEPVCRQVPKEVCNQVPKTTYENVSRKQCRDVPDTVCADVQERKCQITQRPVKNLSPVSIAGSSTGRIVRPLKTQGSSVT